MATLKDKYELSKDEVKVIKDSLTLYYYNLYEEFGFIHDDPRQLKRVVNIVDIQGIIKNLQNVTFIH